MTDFKCITVQQLPSTDLPKPVYVLREQMHLLALDSGSRIQDPRTNEIVDPASTMMLEGAGVDDAAPNQQSAGKEGRSRNRAPHPTARPFRVPLSASDMKISDIENTPHYALCDRLHSMCLNDGSDCYLDPLSGELIFAAPFLAAGGRCCRSQCRHCPFAPTDRSGRDPNEEHMDSASSSELSSDASEEMLF